MWNAIKRLRPAIVSIFLYLTTIPAWAQYSQAPRFNMVTNNNSITITSYVSSYITGPMGEVDVPAFTNGYPVTTISAYAFGSGSMTSVVIPATVTNIGEGVFEYCPYLTNIIVDAANSSYLSTNGSLFNKSMTVLLQYPVGLTNQDYVVPTNVTRIAAYAFSAGYNLLNVTIPVGVTSIGEGAFFYCAYLTNIVIPPGVTCIASNTFLSCGVVSVTVPDTVTNIDRFAFEAAPNLTGVYFYGDAPVVDVYAFLSTGSATAYYLPGKAGWDNTLGGIPTALWLPQMQTISDSETSNTAFGFNINWASGQTVVIEASTNLFAPIWQALQTNTLMTDSIYFSDTDSMNHPFRFYRVHSQ